MPVSGDGCLLALFPTGITNPPVPSTLKYPVPLCLRVVTAPSIVLVIVFPLKLKFSMDINPVPFALKTRF